MQRCRPSVVPTSHIHALVLEIEQRDGLFSLSCHVQHIDPKIVFGLHVGTCCKQ